MNEMNHKKELILRILEKHRGGKKPVFRLQLEKITGSCSLGARKIVADLAMTEGIPITLSVHHSNRLYLITDKQEVGITLDNAVPAERDEPPTTGLTKAAE